MELSKEDIILEPVVTENSWRLQEESNKYVFQVHPRANKVMVREAIEELFGVDVLSVNTMNLKGKPKREQLNQEKGRTSSWKKAYVKLSEGDRIDIFG
ncbi:50S ribosomal protein L23 [Candidatus Bipolaricaulota bacterium]|nr:50S ribosomal protein L23 [Candidatus Bipolaricaulota bacterium]MBS3813807.1 50S ribosomal protein L23 [Candidatus Bipolaricaulota bacterium]MBS3824926.1 50S ribosomal protein L23 [Candidatus Bipolaricaulota bacterium]